MSFYKHHVFFCLNIRDEQAPRTCCARHNAEALFAYAKQRIKELGLVGPGQVRINKAGCLDRCEQGPILVVYPNETWYTYFDESDIDEIIDVHCVQGKIVERLVVEHDE